MPKKKKQLPNPLPTSQERLISAALLGVLLLIAAGVITQQSRFDPGLWRAQPGSAITAQHQDEQTARENGTFAQTGAFDAGAAPAGPKADVISGLQPMGPPEDYDSVNLSDKINGKAELYLSAGFEHLQTRRFALASDPARWMERYVYRMDSNRSAFAVYSGQRRPNAEALEPDGITDAYRSANGLFFIHGPFYVEIIASESSNEVQARMEEMAVAFAGAHAAAAEELVEPRLFPQEQRVAGSIVLVPSNAFGIEGLDWIYTALYKWEQSEATAFISRRADARQAGQLAAAFSDYFLEYGGEQVAVEDAGQLGSGARVITILDTFEIVLSHGPFLVGVHEAQRLDQALALANDLQRMIMEFSHE